MEFRRLTERDLKSLLKLYKQLQPNDDPGSVEDSKKVWQEIEENQDILYFGAIDNGKVVSTCYAVYIPNLTRNNRGICFIENVVTDKEYRNRGLASKVIDMAVSYAKEKGCYENKGFDVNSKKAFDMRLK